MRAEADRNKAILAIKRAIVATFDEEKWLELGYVTGEIDAIQRHSRLLRSLHWGDDDYAGCVLRTVPRVLGEDFENLKTVEEFVGLEGWLRLHDPSSHAELYGGEHAPSLTDVEAASNKFDVVELKKHATRIRRSIGDDPEQAIGSAKELLETALKTVLEEHGQKSGTDDLPKLMRRAQKELELDPRDIDGALPGADKIKRTLSNMAQLVDGVAHVRNLYGTGHGRSRARELGIAHARLVVNAAVSLATFLLDVAYARRGQ